MSRNVAALKQAQSLQQQGRWAQAEMLLRKILETHPDHPDALYQLALLKTETGAFSEAHYFATSALQADPGSVQLQILLGRILTETGSHDAALAEYDRALALSPQNAEALFGRGFVLQWLARLPEALESYASALAVKPDQAEVWCNHGNVLLALKRYDEALHSFEQGLQRMPGVALLHFNRANTLNVLGCPVEALAAFDRALQLDPGNVDMRNNRGNARQETGDLAGATEDFRRMIVDAPGDARGYNGLGFALQDQGELDEAATLYQRSISLHPEFADARHNLALVRLFQQNFAVAWPEYEHRCNPGGYREQMRKTLQSVALFEGLPRWHGSGTTVAGPVGIWYEQGIGDQILFSTLIPELVESGQPFVYEVDPRLLPAYQRSFPAVQFIGSNDPPDAALATAGAALFCGSLPGLFRSSVESFARQPRRILQAAPERVAHYRSRFGEGFKLALSWRSARVGRLGASKTASLADFAPLLAVPGVRGIDVQYGDTAAERAALSQTHGVQIEHAEGVDFYQDLDEVLAILEACDLLITTSNANAHLAAALGKPVWLLYPGERAPFHYWAHGGDHRCLWYPSVEIISAPNMTDWPRLIAYTAEKLQARR